MRQNVPLFFLAMVEFSTVKKACDFIAFKVNAPCTFKYEILHGKRFYFVWQAYAMPFNQIGWQLICRGDKEQVLNRMQKMANQPELPLINF